MLPYQIGGNRPARINENVPQLRMARFGYPPPGPGWMMPMPHSNRPFRPNFPPNNCTHRPNYRFDISSISNKNGSNSKYFHHQVNNQIYNCQYQGQGPKNYSYNNFAGGLNPIQNQNQMYMNNNNIQNRHRTSFQTKPSTKDPISSEQSLGCESKPTQIKQSNINISSSNIDKGKEDQTKQYHKDHSLRSITFGSFEDLTFETRTGVGPEMPGDSKLKCRVQKNKWIRNVASNGISFGCVTKNEEDTLNNIKNATNEQLDNIKNCEDVISKNTCKVISVSEQNYKDIESGLNRQNISNSFRDIDNYIDFEQMKDIYKDDKHAKMRDVRFDIEPVNGDFDCITNYTQGHTDAEKCGPCVIKNQTSDEDESEKENENDEFNGQGEKDTSDEPEEEQRKFTKSYWRKQRRNRLKERLLAQKALMESDPNYIPEHRDNSKDSKNTKTKAIDYDLYLPAHVLMHVKRDLVSVLMEYGQTREVKVTFEDMERSGPHHASRFHTAAVVDEETFPVGSGSSKKMAKKAAAAHALKIMYERGRSHLDCVNETANQKINRMTKDEIGTHAHKILLVSRHVLETVEETQFINYSKDKICATFVLEHNNKMKIVGLGTGNRCILYQHMTKDGQRVLHSHAEIMAKRAFMRFLYNQLLGYQSNKAHPLFTRSDTGKLKLRDKFQVHLYISRPPCGDAAAFPTISNFPNKMRAIRKQGQLRTIIDDGEGAIPTDFDVPAGPNGKERLRIMTCSDKICRWNVLGVQGALLSHFIDPIYLNSLVIGSHTGDQQGHVPRAVSGRLKCGRLHEVIQRPYRINSPEIHYPIDEMADQYNITKSKQYCITWALGDHDAEILDAITGVANMEPMDDPVPSRVAKTSLFDLFKQVCNRFGRKELANVDYAKAKKSAATFQRMKSFVGQHLAAMGFGQWYSLHQTYGTDSFPCPKQC